MEIEMKLTALIIVVAAAASTSALAQTSTISFSSLSQPGVGFRQIGNTVSQDGFKFSSTGGGFGNILGVWQDSSGNHPVGGSDTTSLMEYYSGATTTMTASDGSAFNLKSIALASWAVGQSGTMMATFIGNRADGSNVNQIFRVTNSGHSTPTLQQFTFEASFSNLSSVRFTQGTNAISTAFQFGNLSVSPVPEPSTAWLFFTGALLFPLFAKRLRQLARTKPKRALMPCRADA